jgi:flagellar basal body P-ring formation protein FlgA
MMRWLLLPALLAATPALADGLVAARTIRAHTIIEAGDLRLAQAGESGGISDLGEAIGLETRVTLYAGRPIRARDLGPPAAVERNQLVTLSYQTGLVTILAEGRALARAGAGDRIRVMNTVSRTTVTGVVLPDGSVRVDPSD